MRANKRSSGKKNAPHDAIVVGKSQEEAASKAVTVDRRDGRHASDQKMSKQAHVPAKHAITLRSVHLVIHVEEAAMKKEVHRWMATHWFMKDSTSFR